MDQERVLIVEDEENERTGLAELIRAWGYQTDTAVDGADGWAKVESWGPAIVLTDLKMPRMDGMQLLEQIADAPQQVAVILLTAMGMSILTSAATAAPLSPPALMQVAAKHHHVARQSQTCDETDPKQVYDWSHWPNNPCWPCVSGSPG